MSSLSARQRFGNILQRDSTLSSSVFNASAGVPTTPGGTTYLSATDHDDPTSVTALMGYHGGAAQRSVSDRRPRPPVGPLHARPVDVSSDLIEMDSFRYRPFSILYR